MTNPVYSVPLDLVTTAVLELLRSTGRPVFDGAYGRVPELEDEDPAYAADPLRPSYPYGILYRIPGGSSDPMPDLDGEGDEVTAVWQVTAVSNLRNQCEATARVFRDRLLARTPTGFVYPLAMPAGWACIDRRPDPAMPGVDRTGDTPNALFSQPARYLLTISPA